VTVAPRVPAYLYPSEIAKISRTPRATVMTDLRNVKLIKRFGRGRFRVPSSALRDKLPEYYDALYEHFVLHNDSADMHSVRGDT
jgi:hypothetical protein